MSANSSGRGASPAEQAVVDACTEPLSRLGVDLEDVTITKAGRRELVRVVVDRDGGVDLDTVAEVSRLVSDLLDEPELERHLAGAFVLEVSSPGVDRPLTQPRHWRRAVGRLVEVRTVEGETFIARVVDVLPSGTVVLDADGTSREVALESVARAVVQVEFTSSDQDKE